LKSISDHLKKQRIDNMTFFTMLDLNKDGTVNDKEFVDGILDLQIKGLTKDRILKIFDVIDSNKSGTLQLGEIWFFIEGSQPTA